MKQIKVYIGFAVAMIALTVSLFLIVRDKNEVEEKWKAAVENVKSYSEQFSSSEEKNRAFKLTIGQLKNSNDSIFKELNEARKELMVKDSKLRSLQYVSSDFSKADTIHLTDTIFRDTKANVDTLLSDDWYSIRVGLRYPSTVAVKPEFRSVKSIIVSTRRETVNPPKRFFLFRWFQKRQTVLNVDVVERNPYVRKQTDRYVEIIR